MANWIEEIENNLGLTVLVAVLIGLLVPQAAALYVFAKPILMLMVFLAAIKMKTAEFKASFASMPAIAAFYVLFFVALPVVAFLAVKDFLQPDYAIALLAMLLMPAGVSTPPYAELLKGKPELSLFTVTITMIAAPFVVPPAMFLLTGKVAGEAVLPMFVLLAQLLAIPFAAAIAARKLFPAIVTPTRKYYSIASLALVVVLIASSLAFAAESAKQKILGAVIPLALVFALFLALALAGYYLFARKREERVSFGLAAFHRNYSAGIVFAGQFLSAEALLFIVLVNIPFALAVAAYSFFLKRVNSNS
ncbi:MAG: hypothetical protein V1817_01225 [Candidatus Micrarchaeota archaeon]